jgi:hypothetical protein
MRNLCRDPSRSFDKPHASRIAMSAALSSTCPDTKPGVVDAGHSSNKHRFEDVHPESF